MLFHLTRLLIPTTATQHFVNRVTARIRDYINVTAVSDKTFYLNVSELFFFVSYLSDAFLLILNTDNKNFNVSL
jgi:hypothetical protein